MIKNIHNLQSKEQDETKIARKKRLLFRANHRGIKEMDLVLGQFSAKNIESLTDNELDMLEQILSLDDRDLYSFVIGEKDIPQELKTPLLMRILKQ